MLEKEAGKCHIASRGGMQKGSKRRRKANSRGGQAEEGEQTKQAGECRQRGGGPSKRMREVKEPRIGHI
jgi:hypothetical protein